MFGRSDGKYVGSVDGSLESKVLGIPLGKVEGSKEGIMLGVELGLYEGAYVGFLDSTMYIKSREEG